ncbi:MAG TPA: hypothetical protein VM223_09105 [Planctomycetota bacterium]|nr:hypothetical protein [Planctomycetota bacterium]
MRGLNERENQVIARWHARQEAKAIHYDIAELRGRRLSARLLLTALVKRTEIARQLGYRETERRLQNRMGVVQARLNTLNRKIAELQRMAEVLENKE